jgi:hypothetical protein
MMTLEDLQEALEEFFPNGFELSTDDEGQIIIYTGLMEDEDGDLVEFESSDEDYDDEDEDEEEDDDEDEE